ncbi:hypothetical protein C8J57DRAFT_1514877 [Mycena rebaudengoi]|nr:hypothetical protein C8J57DRAFT_1514877 [Mycena rebaudengoi]
MSDTNPCCQLIVYKPTSLRFSSPHPYRRGHLQLGERYCNLDYLHSLYLMYAISDSDDAESDDDQIPDLMKCEDSPRLYTYHEGCIYNTISLVKSKL